MNPILYFGGVSGGSLLLGLGAGLQFGGAWGLMVTGAAACAVTLSTAWLLTRGKA